MQLDVAVAALDRPVRCLRHVVYIPVAHQTGIDFQTIGISAPQQMTEGLATGFSQQIPERDVDRGDAIFDCAVASKVVQLKFEIVLYLGNLRGVPA